jgi:hypothetical protein
MRTTFLAFLTLFCVVGFSACGDDDSTGTFKLPDLSTKPSPMPDLAIKMTGCNGYLTCVSRAMTQADQDACDAAATQNAMDLLNAVDMCITDACFNTTNKDSGAPFCMSNSDNSAVCTGCIQASIRTGGSCKASLDACRADKP